MYVHLNRTYRFSASHRLHAESLTAAENSAAFGKCNNPHGHGHNYLVTVHLAGHVQPSTGMVVNLGELDAFARTHLLDLYDLTNLNTLPAFATTVPTTENLAIEIYRIFAKEWSWYLESIHIEETGNNSFSYIGSSIALKDASPTTL